MKAFFYLIAFSLFCFSCKNTNQTTKTSANLEASFDISPGTKLVLNELEKQAKAENLPLSKIEPQQKLKDHYTIKNNSGVYHLGGIVKLKKKLILKNLKISKSKLSLCEERKHF